MNIWYAVYVKGSGGQPIALFKYADQAQKWSEEQFSSMGYVQAIDVSNMIIRPVNVTYSETTTIL